MTWISIQGGFGGSLLIGYYRPNQGWKFGSILNLQFEQPLRCLGDLTVSERCGNDSYPRQTIKCSARLPEYVNADNCVGWQSFISRIHVDMSHSMCPHVFLPHRIPTYGQMVDSLKKYTSTTTCPNIACASAMNNCVMTRFRFVNSHGPRIILGETLHACVYGTELASWKGPFA